MLSQFISYLTQSLQCLCSQILTVRESEVQVSAPDMPAVDVTDEASVSGGGHRGVLVSYWIKR